MRSELLNNHVLGIDKYLLFVMIFAGINDEIPVLIKIVCKPVFIRYSYSSNSAVLFMTKPPFLASAIDLSSIAR